jgi:hypothetical protein
MGPFGDRDVTPDWREGLADSPYPGIGEKQVAARLEPPPQPP